MPKVFKFMYRHIPTSCARERLSSVRSSRKILHTLMTSSWLGASPLDRIWRMSVDRAGRVDRFAVPF